MKQPLREENINHFPIVSKASLWGDNTYKITSNTYWDLYYVPVTVLSSLLYTLSHLMLTTILGGRYYYYSIFIDVETAIQRGKVACSQSCS